jgi:hypothetical protein
LTIRIFAQRSPGQRRETLTEVSAAVSTARSAQRCLVVVAIGPAAAASGAAEP